MSLCLSPCFPVPADGELCPAGRHHQGLLHGLLLSRRQAARLALHPKPVWQRELAVLREVSCWSGQGALATQRPDCLGRSGTG